MKKKLKWRYLISLPLITAVFGLGTSMGASRIVKRYEEDRARTLEFQRGDDLIDRIVLQLSNSILRIQSYDELFEFNRLQMSSSYPSLERALRNTVFKRLTIFEMTRPPGKDLKNPKDLPELYRLQRIEGAPTSLPAAPPMMMQSDIVRHAVGRLTKTNIFYQTVIFDYQGMAIFSMVWKQPLSKKIFMVFSTPLSELVGDVNLMGSEKLVVTDPFLGRRWVIQNDSSGRGRKQIIATEDAVPDLPLPSSESSQEDVYSADLRPIFQFIASTTEPGLALYKITFLVGVVLTSLVSYLFWVLLIQNRTISRLVVQKTYDLETANHNLQEALMAKARFLANVSHEIRTPLNLIIGMIDLAEERSSDEKQSSYLNSIKMAGDHLLGMVEDILDVSKPEFQSVEVRKRKINTIQFLDEVAKIITPLCLDHGLQFYLKVDSQVPEQIENDPSRLRQILLNLLRNATKYTPMGYISLKVGKATTTDGRETIRFEVQDTGVGIPRDRLGQIFDAFFQLESAKILAAGGVGLGLSIVRDLVAQLKGEITVNSRVGVGSIFRVDMSAQGSSDVNWTRSFVAPNEFKRTALFITSDEHLVETLNFLSAFPQLKTVVVRPDRLALFDVSQLRNQSVEVLVDVRGKPPVLLQDFLDKVKPEGLALICESQTPPEIRFNGKIEILEGRPLSPVHLLQTLGFKLRARERQTQSAALAVNTAAVVADKLVVVSDESKPLSVLIADDDAGNRELYRAYFESFPWRLRFAKNGKEALDMFLESPAEVLIADLRMPEMDGFTLIEQVRRFEDQKKLKPARVLLVTADALEETAERAKSYPGTYYMTKPVRKKQLIDMVQKMG